MFIVVRCFAPGVRIRMRAFMPVTNVRPSEGFAAAVFDLAIFQSDKLKKFAAKVAELKLTDR